MRFALSPLCLLATVGCGDSKDSFQGVWRANSNDTSDAQAPSDDDRDPGSSSTHPNIEQIPGSGCEMAETAWPLQRFEGPDWDAQTVFQATEEIPTGSWGAAVADFDADGFHDVYLPQIGFSQLFFNDGAGGLVDVSETNLPMESGTGIGATAVDVDGDADLDVIEAGFGQVRVLLNDGNGRFILREDLPVDGRTVYYGSAWADMDGDGDLDGIVSAFPGRLPTIEEVEANDFLPGAPDVLFENTPDGLMDASHRLPDTNDGHTFISAWQDIDGDAQPELLVMNDNFFSGRSNRLWKFNGGFFEDVSARYGLDQGMESMGLGITDSNGDGRPDLLISGWRDLAYMVSDAATGVYISSAVSQGFAPQDESTQWVAWGVEYADLDNSGVEEALVTYGFWELFVDRPDVSIPEEQSDALFVRTGSTVSDEGSRWGFGDQTLGRGISVADMNRDGHPDIIRRPVFDPATIDMPRCTGASWTVIELRQSSGNRYAIGARVQVEAGEQRWVRWIRAGGTGLAGGSPPEVHIGMGGMERIDRLIIQWPDGVETIYTDIPTQHRLVVAR